MMELRRWQRPASELTSVQKTSLDVLQDSENQNPGKLLTVINSTESQLECSKREFKYPNNNP